jgi:hypothetical protein
MFEVMPESRGNLLWLKASGKLTHADYAAVLIPRLESVIREHGRARVLFQMDPDFRGWELGALWDDVKFDLKHLKDFEKVAVVGANRWLAAATKLFAHLMRGEVKTFGPEQLAEAWVWIQAEADPRYPQYRRTDLA